MSTISFLFIIAIVSSVSSQLFRGIELIPNLFTNYGGNNEPTYQTRSNYGSDNSINNVQMNYLPSSPCIDLFYYKQFNNEVEGLLNIHGEVVDTIYINITLSVAVELFSVSFKIS